MELIVVVDGGTQELSEIFGIQPSISFILSKDSRWLSVRKVQSRRDVFDAAVRQLRNVNRAVLKRKRDVISDVKCERFDKLPHATLDTESGSGP